MSGMERPAASLQLCGLRKDFGTQTAVRGVDLDVAPGEMIVLLGPSGCGKTTTLRMIAGFLSATAGDVLLDGQSLLSLPPYRRDIGIVFQSYALFPHLSVARNVRFGLEMRRVATVAADARVADMLRLVKLEEFTERLPRQLSGGQQQRVALARALAIHPRLLLLDEPLSNLDAALRQDMAREIRLLQQQGGITAIVVTHDQAEAMAMADRMVVMREGAVEQVGSQEELYEHPRTPFVATFIGRANLLRGSFESPAALRTAEGDGIALARAYRATGRACLALRPETLTLVAPDAPSVRMRGTVRLATYLGATLEHVVRLDGGTDVIVRGPGTGAAARRHAPGEAIGLSWAEDGERVFDQYDQPAAASAEAAESEQGGETQWAG